MNKFFITLVLALGLSGCASVVEKIPSFWDDNQSARIINVRQMVEQIDCEKPQFDQVQLVARELRWFELYSESKGSRQHDVIVLVEPMKKTVAAWLERKEGSKSYCEIKKTLLTTQAKTAAVAVLGRF